MERFVCSSSKILSSSLASCVRPALAKLARFILTHEAAVSHYVCSKNGSKAAVNSGNGQLSLSETWNRLKIIPYSTCRCQCLLHALRWSVYIACLKFSFLRSWVIFKTLAREINRCRPKRSVFQMFNRSATLEQVQFQGEPWRFPPADWSSDIPFWATLLASTALTSKYRYPAR